MQVVILKASKNKYVYNKWWKKCSCDVFFVELVMEIHLLANSRCRGQWTEAVKQVHLVLYLIVIGTLCLFYISKENIVLLTPPHLCDSYSYYFIDSSFQIWFWDFYCVCLYSGHMLHSPNLNLTSRPQDTHAMHTGW